MKYCKHFLSYSIFVLLFARCGEKEIESPVPEPPEETVQLTSVAIKKQNNPRLQNDIPFEIKGDTIYGKLPAHFHTVTPSFVSNASTVLINGVKPANDASEIDFKLPVTCSFLSAGGQKKDYFFKITWNDSLPHISINTQSNAPVNSKTDYVKAAITIDGKNVYPDYSGTTQIRGRGNSTWGYPKKPYRLKLDTKAELFGLSAEKDWILLANYLDETHLLNNIAFYTGKKLNIPYTNNAIPVELSLNGDYKGVYLFTEQIEVESNRVNVGDEGLLLELDSYYDEDPKFRSDNYQLPVMIKYPDIDNSAELAAIKARFQQMESLVAAPGFPNNNYRDYIDAEALVNYLIVFMLTDNEEMNHPKSIYMHQAAGGKFVMGPLWDFDWAFGYEGTQKHFSKYNTFFWQGTSAGTRFFTRFLADPQIKSLLKQKWQTFAGANDLPAFVEEWAFIIEGARNRDYALWKRGSSAYQTDITALKNWLTNRVNYLTTYINGL